MGLTSTEIIVYFVRCDDCGDRATDSDFSEESAIQNALEEGFIPDSYKNNDLYITDWHCPECYNRMKGGTCPGPK